MKWITLVFRFFVGALFIFSGLIKINDPVGFSIKLTEYFDVFASDFASFFHLLAPYSLTLAVVLCLLEVVLGVNLLTKHSPAYTVNLLLLLIVFFTFLTFYSAYFNKVTDCGCFGDAIPLTPWQSFGKDLLLLIMILWLFFRKKDLDPKMSERSRNAFFVISLVFGFFLAVIAIRHLPFIDFRAYKEGTNIARSMQPSEPLIYKYIMEKDGEQKEFLQYPSDPAWTYVDMQLINPEAQPKITDYSVWNDDGDYTDETFKGRKLMIVIQNAAKTKAKSFAKLNRILDKVDKFQMEAFVVTASGEEDIQNLFNKLKWKDVPYYYGDATVLKTMIRSNPGIILLEEGTILKKWHFRDVPSLSRLEKTIN